MNILILHNTSDLYGGSRILLYVIQALIDRKHRPIVVLSENGPLVEEIEKLGAEVRIIRLGILRRKYLNPKGIINRFHVSALAWKALDKLVSEEAIDLIYSNTTGVLIGAFFAKRKGIRHIWHVHEIITKPKAFTKGIGYLLRKYSDQVIVVSDAVKRHWQEVVGLEKLVRIYNGIDCSGFENQTGQLREELKIESGQVLIGMIGRVNHWKGQDYFLQIAQQLAPQFPEARFVLVGDAYPGNEHLYDQLIENIRHSGIANKIYNLGYRTDIANILKSLDIFVSPSILPDPFPTVILEAMASGKPVVATNHGGAAEMVADQVSGLLIPFDNPVAAAQIIMPLLSDVSFRNKMGQKAHQRIHTNYALEAFNQAILKVIEKEPVTV